MPESGKVGHILAIDKKLNFSLFRRGTVKIENHRNIGRDAEKLTDRADLLAFGVLYWRDCVGRKDLEWALEILGEEFARAKTLGEPLEELRGYLVEHGVTVPEVTAEADRQECEAAILDFLRDTREPQTQAQIRDGVQGKTATIRAALTELARSKSLSRTGDGTKGKPFLYAMPRTGEPESEKVPETSMNTGKMLVPVLHDDARNQN